MLIGKFYGLFRRVTMSRMIGLALSIAVITMVSLVGSAFASSVTLTATMPQVLSIQFPTSQNFGDLIPYTTATVDNQIHINSNCYWSLSVYAQDDGYGHHGYLTQQNQYSVHDWIRNPVNIYFSQFGMGPTSLENYWPSMPLMVTSQNGNYDINYQLSTTSYGVEDSRYPYMITLEFVLTAM
jgi:hypothetical protein